MERKRKETILIVTVGILYAISKVCYFVGWFQDDLAFVIAAAVFISTYCIVLAKYFYKGKINRNIIFILVYWCIRMILIVVFQCWKYTG